MKLIVGLGNPGKKYEATRHNVGFMVIDELAKKFQINMSEKSKFKGVIGQGNIKDQVILLKPTTFMNLSGESVKLVKQFYNLKDQDILIIYDDLDLVCGKVRLRQKGSAGGHNGIKSILSSISSENFHRLKIGIDRDQVIPVVDYVLGKFTKQQKEAIDQAIMQSLNIIEDWVNHDILYVMNKYN
jgi:peptidyl-tRNA hydrolase, PTH1 family